MAVVRPAGIICPKWEPQQLGSKRCRYYIDPGQVREEGLCKLPDEMLCVEWVRRNGTPEQRARLDARPPPTPYPGDDPPPLVLRPPDQPPPRPPARLRTAAGGEVALAPPRPFEPAKSVDPASIEALEAAGVEVELSAPHLGGGVTLVPARTGRTDRAEITWKEAATVRLIVDAFPGAHVTAYRSGAREEPDAHCVTAPDGACVSDDPRCMHQASGASEWEDPLS